MEEKFSILKPNLAANYLGIMLATVIALRKLDGKGTNAQIAKIIIETHDIDEETQKLLVPDSTETLLNLYFSWARTYLRISGDLKNVSRGVWELTESGRKIYNLEDSKQALKRYNEKEAQKKLGILPTTDEASDEINSNDSERDSEPSKKRNFIITPDEPPSILGIMLAIIIAIKELGGSATNYEIIACVIKNEGISEEEQSYTISNDHRSKLSHYLAWVRVYLKISGDLENLGGGVWALTESGFGINTLQDVEESRNRYKKKLKERVKKKLKERDTENWKSILLEILKKTDPNGFEELCGLILRKIGFIKVEITALPNVADGGVDGVGFLRENLLSRKIYFQCKRTKNSIKVDGIRDFRGALDGRANQGLFITTSHFTSDAVKEAVRDGALLIDLIDGNELCDLLKDNNLGVQEDSNGRVTIDKKWFDKYNVKPKTK